MKNILIVVISRGSFAAYSVLFIITLGRELDPHDLSLFAYIDSAKILLCIAPIMGMSQAYIKNYRLLGCNDSYTAAYYCLFTIYLSFFVVAYLIFTSINFLSKYSYINSEMQVALFLFFFSNSIYMFGRGWMLAKKSRLYLFWYELILLFLFVLVLLGLDFSSWLLNDWLFMVSIILLAPICVLISYILFCSKHRVIDVSKEAIWNGIIFQSHYIKFSVPNNIVANMFSIVDSYVIGGTLGNVALADYKAVKVIMSGYVFIGDILNTIIFPKFSEFHIGENINFKLFKKYAEITLILSIPLFVSVNFYAFDVLQFLYQGKYSSNIVKELIFFISVWGLLFVLTRMAASYIGAIGLPETLMKTTLYSGIISAPLLVFLTGLYGIHGFGVSLIFSAILPAIFLYFFSKKRLI